ncbi:MAG: M1 family peptidase [Flavobacteriaceae bacterium TMED220]|nr:MAG: M1 family peptidase [Flavobacteriaceae bacterium TMED220]
MLIKNILFLISFFVMAPILFSQYWQQKADYEMEIELDVSSAQFNGKQRILYTNNSPETLNKVFYHLYFNAFRPGSEMAERQKSSLDVNRRFKVIIDSIGPKSYGKIQVKNLKQNGILLNPFFSETILEVPLANPILPGESAVLDLEFSGQVPDLIRRSGKNSSEGVAFSMAQWYPKLAEYDIDGWNASPYLGREFHGVWGNFDVKITLDKNFTVAASGYLQNPEDIGKGYKKIKRSKSKKGKLTWHFIAPNVHDFTWAADKDYIHDIYPGPNNVKLHFFYKNNPSIIDNWKKLQPLTAELMEYFNSSIGDYPYKQYSVVQGGDGGMEYAMLTLITGERKFGSLVGVTAHELAHSWFQNILATNEMKHEWMDEGFTTYISTIATDKVLKENKIFPLRNAYLGYYNLALSGVEQPQQTNANRYAYNYAYESSAYNKGAVFLSQLGYIIGKENLNTSLKIYFEEFKFKHPTPRDFIRIAERVSGILLNWYLTDWTQTTNTIDYKISGVSKLDNKTIIDLERVGMMPMPLEILISFKNGNKQIHYVPIGIMRGEKKPYVDIEWILHNDWTWSTPNYKLIIDSPLDSIEKITIDSSNLMADIDKSNNYYLNNNDP